MFFDEFFEDKEEQAFRRYMSEKLHREKLERGIFCHESHADGISVRVSGKGYVLGGNGSGEVTLLVSETDKASRWVHGPAKPETFEFFRDLHRFSRASAEDLRSAVSEVESTDEAKRARLADELRDELYRKAYALVDAGKAACSSIALRLLKAELSPEEQALVPNLCD